MSQWIWSLYSSATLSFHKMTPMGFVPDTVFWETCSQQSGWYPIVQQIGGSLPQQPKCFHLHFKASNCQSAAFVHFHTDNCLPSTNPTKFATEFKRYLQGHFQSLWHYIWCLKQPWHLISYGCSIHQHCCCIFLLVWLWPCPQFQFLSVPWRNNTAWHCAMSLILR